MQTRKRKRLVDFNTLLMGLNVLIAMALLFCLDPKLFEDNPYINQESIVLALVLCLQTHVALWLERRWRDPFVIVLAFELIFFFGLRLVTLTFYPFSAVFDRYSYYAADSNFALIFILIANVFLYAGLFSVRYPDRMSIDTTGWRATSALKVIVLLICTIAVSYLSSRSTSGAGAGDSGLPRYLNFLVLVFSPAITVLMALVYVILLQRSLPRMALIAVATLILGEMLAHTLIGSRSAIMVFLEYCMFAVLAIRGRIAISSKQMLIGVVLAPAVAAGLVVTFVISSYNRASAADFAKFDLGSALKVTKEGGAQLSSSSLGMDAVIPPIANRAGFFDFSAEIIAHRDAYASQLNMTTYGKSIIDNILTPGFDVFDQPKISNSLYFLYDGLGTPAKSKVVSEDYQSDQLGIYGEFYGLFGYFSLPLFFLTGIAFKRVYGRAKASNPFMLAMRRVIALVMFLWIMESFGIDWAIIQVLTLIAGMYMFSFFFVTRRTAADVNPQVPDQALAT